MSSHRVKIQFAPGQLEMYRIPQQTLVVRDAEQRPDDALRSEGGPLGF
jgi:hypothetical protein